MTATPSSPAPRPGRVDTIRCRRLDPRVRAEITTRREQLLDQLRSVDRSLARLATERRRLLDRLAELDAELHHPAPWPRSRRPGQHTLDDALPPLPEHVRWLWGRRLRAVCLRLLHRCGTLPLRQLHALLHLHGYGIAGDHPVKTLADALGHETEAGHARRIGRGRYGIAPGHRPPRLRHGFLTAVELPDLDE